jgi:hypothetical protein
LTPRKVKVLLDKFRLREVSSYILHEELENNFAQVIENQKIFGGKYVAIPDLMPDHQSEDGYQVLISVHKLNEHS